MGSLKLFMNRKGLCISIVVFVKLANWPTGTNKICRLYNNTEKGFAFFPTQLPWKTVRSWLTELVKGFYLSNQQSNYKGSLLGSPHHVIWSQWLDLPLIGEGLPNCLRYAGYKLTLLSSLMKTSQMLQNIFLQSFMSTQAFNFCAEKHLTSYRREGNNVNNENDKLRGNLIIFTNTAWQRCHIGLITNYHDNICQV